VWALQSAADADGVCVGGALAGAEANARDFRRALLSGDDQPPADWADDEPISSAIGVRTGARRRRSQHRATVVATGAGCAFDRKHGARTHWCEFADVRLCRSLCAGHPEIPERSAARAV